MSCDVVKIDINVKGVDKVKLFFLYIISLIYRYFLI